MARRGGGGARRGVRGSRKHMRLVARGRLQAARSRRETTGPLPWPCLFRTDFLHLPPEYATGTSQHGAEVRVCGGEEREFVLSTPTPLPLPATPLPHYLPVFLRETSCVFEVRSWDASTCLAASTCLDVLAGAVEGPPRSLSLPPRRGQRVAPTQLRPEHLVAARWRPRVRGRA